MGVRKLRVVVTLAFIAVISVPTPAWAYVDPGLGSYIFQLTIAGFLAGVYTLRHYSQVVTGFFRRQRRTLTPDQIARGHDVD